jgi:F-type H+-transporting ATPase subunit b
VRRIGCFVALYAICLGAPAFAGQENVEHETREGRQSPEGGAYGAGADVNESEATGIDNWWSWDYGKYCKDGQHRDRPPPFGFALINFAVFLGIMSKLLWKPLQKMAADRHDGIGSELREASRLRKEAEAELEKYKAKVSNIDREVETLLQTIHKQAEEDKARIIAAAEADARRLKSDAEKQIAAEIDRARRELRRTVVETAVSAADESLKRNVGADDQRKMAERYVHDVEAQAKQGRPS